MVVYTPVIPILGLRPARECFFVFLFLREGQPLFSFEMKDQMCNKLYLLLTQCSQFAKKCLFIHSLSTFTMLTTVVFMVPSYLIAGMWLFSKPVLPEFLSPNLVISHLHFKHNCQVK